MTTSAPVAPPRWPADAALLREVLAWARAEGWRRMCPAFEIGKPRDDLAFGVWTRGEPDEDGIGPEFVAFPRDLADADCDELTGPGMLSDLCDGVKVESVAQAIDLLVTLRVLPIRFSFGYRCGRAAVEEEVHACAEFGEGSHVWFDMARIMPVLGDALTYWSSIACSDGVEAVVGSRLDGLLDREPFARRRQTEDVVSSVMDGLAAHLAHLLKAEEASRA